MQEEFDLESVLTVVTGINFTDDFNKVFDLYSFIFEDPLISTSDIIKLKDIAKKHLLKIHPWLTTLNYNGLTSTNNWLQMTKTIYGDDVLVSIIGEPVIDLDKNSLKLEKRSYVSNR